MTGPFGSGCTELAKKYLEPRGYRYISLSDYLKKSYREEKGTEGDPYRHELQDYGNHVRRTKGNDYLASKALQEIKNGGSERWVIDSIRNPQEVHALAVEFARFYLFSVYADKETRWNRVSGRYRSRADFDVDESRDANEKVDFGQRVVDCHAVADIVFANNRDYGVDDTVKNQIGARVNRYLSAIEKNVFSPNEDEALMAMAYASSMRSSCKKRRVGAVILGAHGKVLSTSYNEVPPEMEPCVLEHGKCYRDKMKEEIGNEIGSIVTDAKMATAVQNTVFSQVKVLDYCRALHAEESAILNVAMTAGLARLERATLYTTTYPCNLCANKIAYVKMKKVVYLEPYPMKEAQRILNDHGVGQVPFEGVTYQGYFRFAGGR